MKQFRHTIQHHNLHMQAPVRLSHINLYHCDTPTSDVEGTEKVDNTAYIWYNVYIKYRRCFL